jgi:hypothetical protein
MSRLSQSPDGLDQAERRALSLGWHIGRLLYVIGICGVAEGACLGEEDSWVINAINGHIASHMAALGLDFQPVHFENTEDARLFLRQFSAGTSRLQEDCSWIPSALDDEALEFHRLGKLIISHAVVREINLKPAPPELESIMADILESAKRLRLVQDKILVLLSSHASLNRLDFVFTCISKRP